MNRRCGSEARLLKYGGGGSGITASRNPTANSGGSLGSEAPRERAVVCYHCAGACRGLRHCRMSPVGENHGERAGRAPSCRHNSRTTFPSRAECTWYPCGGPAGTIAAVGRTRVCDIRQAGLSERTAGVLRDRPPPARGCVRGKVLTRLPGLRPTARRHQTEDCVPGRERESLERTLARAAAQHSRAGRTTLVEREPS